MAKQFDISNTPKAEDLWKGIGGHFDTLGQIINEFLDNSISNFIKTNPKQRNIQITIKQLSENGNVEIMIEDSGSGIKDLDSAFALGSHKDPDSPLNEHGFGMKHALASANPNNDEWSICTRTKEDFERGTFKEISAKYLIEGFKGAEKESKEWPGEFNSPGTIVRFVVSNHMFLTLGKKIKGGVTSFITASDILCEDIGFVYSEIIKDGIAQITLIVAQSKGDMNNYVIGAVEPDIAESFGPKPAIGTTKIDLGNGFVDLEYKFVYIREKKKRELFDNNTTRKYYKCSMSSSGVEIRLNGRLLCYNIFDDVWGIEKHNTYNSMLIMINIISNDPNALPKTRTSKNGLRKGDDKLVALYEWILKHVPNPPKDSTMATHETELFDAYKDNIKKSWELLGVPFVLTTEQHVFTKTGNDADKVRADLYMVKPSTAEVVVYEGKKEKTSAKDVYQLRMYWDGLVYDGIRPDEGILVASEHPETVESIVDVVNGMKDANGNNYNFRTTTWKDLGIDT